MKKSSDDSPRFFTTYWRWPYWHQNTEREPCRSSGSNLYRERRLRREDTVYVFSNCGGIVHLGGRMVVKEVLSRRAAIKLTGNRNLYDSARWWIMSSDKDATPLRLGRSLDPAIAKQLRFVTSDGDLKGLFFDGHDLVDRQSLRGVRRLDEASARLLDEILRITDADPSTEIRVTLDLLKPASTNIGPLR